MLRDFIVIRVNLVFFFFKQKTAYEITYGDWSSDVCSSDLPEPGPRPTILRRCVAPGAGRSSSSLTGHLEDVRGLRDHAAHGRCVLVGHLLPDAAEPQRPDRRLLLRGEADERARQRDPKLRACHQLPPPPGSRPRHAAARRAGPAGA